MCADHFANVHEISLPLLMGVGMDETEPATHGIVPAAAAVGRIIEPAAVETFRP
jgi:hypothetical protein